jgi:cyanophycinase-like exopeptidase
LPGWLTLIGSGETAGGMTKTHRALLQGLGGPAKVVFLETPAGFELGAGAIRDRFREYVERNLGVSFAAAPYRRSDDDPALRAAALAAVTEGNYIIAGPGSPSYAVRAWRGTSFFSAVVERWMAGAQLVFASAAAIALARHTLPVYEIYKVGQPLHWIEGLDLLGPFGFDVAIVTHWDNAEGGTHDTRACFMGLERFAALRMMLPATAVVLAVDEHTACTLDLDAGHAAVRGRGGVTILRGEETLRHAAGESFSLAELAPLTRVGATQAPPHTPEAEGRIPDILARATTMIAGGELAAGLRLASEGAAPDLAAVLHQAAQALDTRSEDGPAPSALIDLLLVARSALRDAQQWALADRLRDGLADLGIEVQDTPDGAVWARR